MRTILTVPLTTAADARIEARIDRIVRTARKHLLKASRSGNCLCLRYRCSARAELTRIVRIERECCAQLTYTLAVSARHIDLIIGRLDRMEIPSPAHWCPELPIEADPVPAALLPRTRSLP